MEEEKSTWSQNPRHLSNEGLRRTHVFKKIHAGDDIKASVGKREIEGIGFDIIHRFRMIMVARHFKALVRIIDSAHKKAVIGKLIGEEPGTAADIQNARITRRHIFTDFFYDPWMLDSSLCTEEGHGVVPGVVPAFAKGFVD